MISTEYLIILSASTLFLIYFAYISFGNSQLFLHYIQDAKLHKSRVILEHGFFNLQNCGDSCITNVSFDQAVNISFDNHELIYISKGNSTESLQSKFRINSVSSNLTDVHILKLYAKNTYLGVEKIE